jgi:scyllo-inositol 2-dehydrogenase (NADP+)
MLNVGIVGVGLAARHFHIPILKTLDAQFQINAIFSNQPQESIRLLLGPVTVFSNFLEFCQSGLFELAVVVTPNYLHYSMAKQLIEAGIHTIVDKPLANTVTEASHLYQLANANNVVLSVFHNRRWDSDFLTVENLLVGKKLGNLTYFESRFDKYRPTLSHRWREQAFLGSGILYDIGPHLIDQAITLFGLPLFIQASVEMQRYGAKVDDYFSITLKYPSLNVVLRCSSLAVQTPFRFYLEGSAGSLIKLGVDGQESFLANNSVSSCDFTWPTESPRLYGTFYTGEKSERVTSIDGDYREYYKNIYDVILNGATPAISQKNVMDVMNILELAKQSSLTNSFIALEN